MGVLDKLLEIEENDELYSYAFSYKNTLMYPFIRFTLLQGAIENKLKVFNYCDPLKAGLTKRISYILKRYLYRPSKKVKSDIVFFGSDISNIPCEGAYFNRLTESFANEYSPNTILIEVADRMNYKRPRTYPKVYTIDIFSTIVKIKSLTKNIKTAELNKIDCFIEYLKQYFSHEFINSDIWYSIKNTLIRFCKELPLFIDEYKKMLKKISPKVIFVQCACYGEGHVPLILAAKELGIPVGEYQHGLISLAHPAYNYSAKIFDCYKYYMPDFFMSYSKFWTKNCRIPLRIFEVGNPYLSEVASQNKQMIKKEHILYISSGVEPERCAHEVIWLNENIVDKGYSVAFRIHPSEVHRLKTVYKPIIDAGIPIDTNPLYDTLKYANYIIGHISTVLFEATMFDCIVFVIKTPLSEENLDVTLFNDADSIKEIVNNIILGNYKKNDPNYFWSDNWRTKYRQIIDPYLEN